MNRKNQVKFSFIATLIMIFIMQFQGKILKAKGFDIVSFELAKTTSQAETIMTQWGATGVEAARLNTFIDFFFILAYVSFGYFISLILTESDPNSTVKRMGKRMAQGMIIAGAFDVIENIAMLQTLNNNISEAFTQAAFWFATFKFSIIALVLIAAIIFLIRRNVK
jgi:uncharacterized membrane protein